MWPFVENVLLKKITDLLAQILAEQKAQTALLQKITEQLTPPPTEGIEVTPGTPTKRL